MAHHESTTTATTVPTAAACGCIGKLMRKLKKKSHKMVCLASSRPNPPFDFHYDPLSYAQNFDDNSSHIFSGFSSRFVAAAATQPLVQSNIITR